MVKKQVFGLGIITTDNWSIKVVLKMEKKTVFGSFTRQMVRNIMNFQVSIKMEIK